LVTAGCDTDDEICRSIYYQSNCGALKRLAKYDTRQSWAVMARHEIEWKSNCKSTMSDIDTANDNFQNITDLLLSNLIIVVICTYFSLSCYVFLLNTGIYPKLGGRAETFFKSLIQSYLLPILSLIKLISLVITLIMISPTITIISNGSSCATDHTTTSVFDDLSGNVGSVNVLLWFAIAIDGIGFILIMVTNNLMKRRVNDVTALNNSQQTHVVTAIEMN